MRLFGLFLIAAIYCVFSGQPALSHGDPLTEWADKIGNFPVLPLHMKPTSTTVDDQFGPPLDLNGQMADTPCSGTLWVYDYGHSIAGGRERSDPTGGMLKYAVRPPVHLPDRNLLVVKSTLGLHLGMSAADAVRLLRVPLGAVVDAPNHLKVLYVEKIVPCGSYRCAHEVVVTFKDDRAIALSIHHAGP